MRALFSTALAFALLTTLAAPARAQRPDARTGRDRSERAERMIERRIERLDDALALSGRQETRLRALLRDRTRRARREADRVRGGIGARCDAADDAARRACLHREAAAHRDQSHREMARRAEALDADIRRLLTADQVRRYDVLRREERARLEERLRERRDGHPGGPPRDRSSGTDRSDDARDDAFRP